MQKHPRALPIIFTTEFFDQFNYWGLQSLLVLYLTQKMLLNNAKAYLVYGTFSALTYVFAILGGYIADNFLGKYSSLRTGALFAVLGYLILLQGRMDALFVGLALIVCGKALFMPNNAGLLGVCYHQAESKRNQGCSYLYIGTNLGSLVGPAVYGILLEYSGWTNCFLVSIALYAILQGILTLNKSSLYHSEIAVSLPTKLIPKKKTSFKHFPLVMIFIALLLLIVVSYYLLQNIQVTGLFLAIFGIGTLTYLIMLVRKKYPQDKKVVYALISMMVICAIFFTFEFQIYSSLMIFNKDYVDLNLFFWRIPLSTTVIFEPIVVIAFAPLFAWLWKRLADRSPSIHTRLLIGVLLCAVCFFILAGMAYRVAATQQHSSLYPLILANVFLGAGEACLMPTLLAATSRFAPLGLNSLLMGGVFFSNSISGYLDGLVATLTTPADVNAVATPDRYGMVYLYIALGLTVLTAIYYLGAYFFRKKYYANSNLNLL